MRTSQCHHANKKCANAQHDLRNYSSLSIEVTNSLFQVSSLNKIGFLVILLTHPKTPQQFVTDLIFQSKGVLETMPCRICRRGGGADVM